MSKLNRTLHFIASHGNTKFSSQLQEGILGSLMAGARGALGGLKDYTVSKAIDFLGDMQGVGGPLAAMARGFVAGSEQAKQTEKSLKVLNELKQEQEERVREIKKQLSNPSLSDEEKDNLQTQLSFALKNINAYNTQIINITKFEKGVRNPRDPRSDTGAIRSPSPSPGSSGGTTGRVTP